MLQSEDWVGLASKVSWWIGKERSWKEKDVNASKSGQLSSCSSNYKSQGKDGNA